MQTTTVRFSKKTHHQLRLLSQQMGETTQDVLAKAVELYQERIFWQRVHEAYARLRTDSVAWQEEIDERRLWDKTLMDGMEEV